MMVPWALSRGQSSGVLGKLQEQLASDVKVLRSVGETMQEADEHAASCMDASE